MVEFQRPKFIDISEPFVDIYVNGKLVSDGILAMVERVTYESCDIAPDMLEIVLKDPRISFNGNSEPRIFESSLFAMNNDVQIVYGYNTSYFFSSSDVFLIRKIQTSFSNDGPATMTVTCYAYESRMQDNGPAPKEYVPGEKNRRENEGRYFIEKTNVDIARDVAKRYKWRFETNFTSNEVQRLPFSFQGVNVSDYDLLNSMANADGAYFYVKKEKSSDTPTLRYIDPSLPGANLQDTFKEYQFNVGDNSSVIGADFTSLLRGDTYDIIGTVVKDGKPYSVQVSRKLGQDTYNLFTEDNEGKEWIADDPTGVLADPELTPPDLDIHIQSGDFAIAFPTDLVFSDPEEFAAYIKKMYLNIYRNLYSVECEVIPDPSLKARQVHKLTGFGTSQDGLYEISKVTHEFTPEGYTCVFAGNRFLGTEKEVFDVIKADMDA